MQKGAAYYKKLPGCLLAAAVLVAGFWASNVSARPGLQGPAAQVLAEAQNWLEQGQGKTAYQLLYPLEESMAGVPAFDYLFGQAALSADQPSRAAFAFERCLAIDPRNGVCRLGMARAHIALAEKESARQELDLIAQAAPPDPVKKAVADYLALLAGDETLNQDSRLSSYVRLGVGYDSNINTATSLGGMYIPLLGQVLDLNRDGRRRESGFARARFHINYSRPLARRWRLLTEANIEAVGNFETRQYNSVVSDASIGLMYQHDKHQVSGKLLGQNYQLDGHSYRNLGGFLGQYVYSLTDRSQLSTFAQVSRLSYPGARLRNANRYVAGVSWSQAFGNDRAVGYISAYGGNEKPVHAAQASSETDYRLAGVRVGGMYMVTPRLQVETGVGLERRHFRQEDILFKRKRRETFYDGYLGLNYAINRKLSLRPQYRVYRSSSNIPLRTFKRHVISLNLQYELF